MPTGGTAGKKVKAGETFEPRRLDTPLDKMMRRNAGRRSRTHTERKRGRYIQARPANGKTDDLAFDATLRAAAPFQKRRTEASASKVAFAVQPGDLHAQGARAPRRQPGALPGGCLLVDGGRRAHGRHQGRHPLAADRCLPAPRPGRADRLPEGPRHAGPAAHQLGPAGRASAHRYPGGRQDPPLRRAADGLRGPPPREDPPPGCAAAADHPHRRRRQCFHGHVPPQEEAHQIAELIATENIHTVVINMEHAAFDQGLAQALADHLKALLHHHRPESRKPVCHRPKGNGPGANPGTPRSEENQE